MPLLQFDLIKGRSEDEVILLLDTAHRAMLEAFEVPERDRYQIVNEHPPYQMQIEDTGLGLRRTASMVVIRVTTRPRTVKQKRTFYRLLARYLYETCALDPEDLMVTIVENSDADWSFGRGDAQFLCLGDAKQKAALQMGWPAATILK